MHLKKKPEQVRNMLSYVCFRHMDFNTGWKVVCPFPCVVKRHEANTFLSKRDPVD